MKILIMHPDFEDQGGVAKYYLKLRGKFSMTVEHYILGKRPDEGGVLSKFLRIIRDYGIFMMKLRMNQYSVIHVNPSLDFKAVLRDGVFLLLARMHKKKTIVFFRGWHKMFESKLRRNGLWLFRILYGKTNAFIVLSNEVKMTLRSWGYSQPIYREVTIIDDDTLEGFEIHKTIAGRKTSQTCRILFLSRVLKEKGIYETIKAVSILQTRHLGIELIIAGDGYELQRAKSYVNEHGIQNVTFTGYVSGQEKKELLETANIFCFPSYGEGMPNVVIEAMAFGLPVVTRRVGGLADFFKDGEHGFFTTSKDPIIFADFIEKLLVNQQLYEEISLNNYQYAQSNFLASCAAKRLEQIYRSVLAE